MCYSLWYNAPTILPVACSLEAEAMHPLPGYRLQETSWVQFTTSCNTQSSAPEHGRNHHPKHVELIGFMNKPLLLHLVGCLYYVNNILHNILLTQNLHMLKAQTFKNMHRPTVLLKKFVVEKLNFTF